VTDIERARTVPCPICKMGAGQRCVDIANSGPDGGGPEVDGVHQPRIYRAYLVGEAIAENVAYELRIVLERLTQAAEQYLTTDHCSAAREVELRRNLGQATTDAALWLTSTNGAPS
jgi:hypothetical protein